MLSQKGAKWPQMTILGIQCVTYQNTIEFPGEFDGVFKNIYYLNLGPKGPKIGQNGPIHCFYKNHVS